MKAPAPAGVFFIAYFVAQWRRSAGFSLVSPRRWLAFIRELKARAPFCSYLLNPHFLRMATPTKNTPMYYPWHHFVLLPLALLMAGYAITRYTKVAGDDDQIARLWFTVAALAVIGFGVLVMLRQHYALQLQDRICRLEVRQRYFEVSGQRFAPLEKQLSIKQILSLRLAGDAELPTLAQAAASEKLSPKDIQARITDFQFDTMRV